MKQYVPPWFGPMTHILADSIHVVKIRYKFYHKMNKTILWVF